jgi:cyclophilin family peptidyl-prolyl cis-trans isomerase
MKHSLIAAMVALLAVGGVAVDGAHAQDMLQNHIGSVDIASGNPGPLDIEDFISVYRFDVPTVGVFDAVMYDARTPLTVANFRGYADRGDYEETFVHRSVDVAGSGIGMIQAGGFAFNDAEGGYFVHQGSAVLNEPGLSNITGTLALAKTASGPDSGTNQWFINTADNPVLDLEANNGGYTVFGEVLYDGMDVVGVDGGTGGIANMPTYDATAWHTHFGSLPMHDPFMDAGDIDEADLAIFDTISQVTGLTYSVLGSSNPALVTGSFIGSDLTLAITPGMSGHAALTIRTTDPLGQSFDSVLLVVPEPATMGLLAFAGLALLRRKK